MVCMAEWEYVCMVVDGKMAELIKSRVFECRKNTQR